MIRLILLEDSSIGKLDLHNNFSVFFLAIFLTYDDWKQTKGYAKRWGCLRNPITWELFQPIQAQLGNSDLRMILLSTTHESACTRMRAIADKPFSKYRKAAKKPDRFFELSVHRKDPSHGIESIYSLIRSRIVPWSWRLIDDGNMLPKLTLLKNKPLRECSAPRGTDIQSLQCKIRHWGKT